MTPAVLDLPVLPGKLLAIRHDGLGWLSFVFPQNEADKLALGLSGPSSLQQTGLTLGRRH
jgi:hypothetical protein